MTADKIDKNTSELLSRPINKDREQLPE